MEVLAYRSPISADRLANGSFVDRNPNMSYLAYSKDKQAVLIDTCSEIDAVSRDMEKRGLRLSRLLLTHNHQDHTFALRDWIKKFPDLPIGIHGSSLSALAAGGVKQAYPLKNGMPFKVGGETIMVMATPGHTKDSLCFWDKSGNNLFTGDVIMGGGIGCCDYQNGGNRNIFYQTIVCLLKILPLSTRIYPGHFSEHYQTPPPYELAMEKIKNPYLANVLAGKRGDFDRALKIFSLEFETAGVMMLDVSALDAICNLEKDIWIPELQASREVIQERLLHGHRLLTIKENTGFAGMLGWCYSPFSIEAGHDGFPRNFMQFSNCQSCNAKMARSAFIYNLGVKPAARRKGTGSQLLQEAFEQIRKEGISQVFIDSRLPSYNGSTQHAQEKVSRNQAFREAVDRYFSTGRLSVPEDQILLLDPAVSFYMKNGLVPWLILRDFIRDEPSGNMRIICYINIDQDSPPISAST
jgi:glyoxylase-like metal-dependent hydrolase (beta-lactamase superfamily II)/GNAT superfamily N-acetyltransferase